VHAYRQEALPKVVCDIARRAQLRLTPRFRRLVARGKAKPKVATAIARELTGPGGEPSKAFSASASADMSAPGLRTLRDAQKSGGSQPANISRVNRR
jgi:hypothetical protein